MATHFAPGPTAPDVEVSDIMGRGLERLHLEEAASGHITRFGGAARALDDPAVGRVVSGNAAKVATVGAGRFIQQAQERDRNWLERSVYLSPAKRAQEAARVERGSAAAGVAAVVLVEAGRFAAQRYFDGRERFEQAALARRVVGFAATADDGSVVEANQAVLSCLLGGFGLSTRRRAIIVARPLPSTIGEIEARPLPIAWRDSLASVAFHVAANRLEPDEAERMIVPLFMGLGMSRAAARRRASAEHQDYLSDRELLSHHYAVLQTAVAGTAMRLSIPLDTIEAGVEHVLRYDPGQEARARNRQTVVRAIRAGRALTLATGLVGPVAPALSITLQAAEAVIGRMTELDRAEFSDAFRSFGSASGLPVDSVDRWAAGSA